MLRKVCTGMLALLLGFAGPVLAGFSAGPVYAETANLTVNVNTVDGSQAAVSCTVRIEVAQPWPKPTLSAYVTAPGSAVFKDLPVGQAYTVSWRQEWNSGQPVSGTIQSGGSTVNLELGRFDLVSKNEDGGAVQATFIWNGGPQPTATAITADVVPLKNGGTYTIKARTQQYLDLPEITGVAVAAGETEYIDFVWAVMKVKAVWVPTGGGYAGLSIKPLTAYMWRGSTGSDGVYATLANHGTHTVQCRFHDYDEAYVQTVAGTTTSNVASEQTPGSGPPEVRPTATAWSVVKWGNQLPIVARIWEYEVRRIKLDGNLGPMDVFMTLNDKKFHYSYGYPKKEMGGVSKPKVFAGTGGTYTFETHPRIGSWDPPDPRKVVETAAVPDDPTPGRRSGHTCQFP